MLAFLNVFFLVFHTLLILFNAVGWAWRRTRRFHLFTVLATAFSWLLMGLWYGVGYCVCTDWHFQVRRAMGIHDTDSTYIQFLVRELTGWKPDDGLVQAVTGAIFAIVFILTVVLNIRDARARRAVPA